MKKNLVSRLMLLLALALSLQSCRTGEDYLSAKEEQYYSNKFQVFTSFNDEPIDYAKGFKTLMENYDGIHKTHYTRTSAIKSGNLGKSDEEYVEFRLHSQSMLLEDERWIIYPMVRNGQVSGLMAGILRNEETEVEFRKLDSGNDYYDEVLKIFSMAYLKNKLKSGLNKGSGCGFDSNDACDIGNIDISPPKGGPKGTGPKSGCTGLNNCIKSDPGGSGGSEGGGGVGDPPANPCDKIKNKMVDPKFKEKIAALDKPNVFDYNHEMGYAAGYPTNTSATGTQYPPMENTIGSHSVQLPQGNQYFGFIHTHNNESNGGVPIKIFSPYDVITFLTSCVRNAQGHGNIGDAFAVVITSGGNYMLVYSGMGNYNIGPVQIAQWSDWYRDTFQGLTDDNNLTQENIEKTFAQFLDEKVKIGGLEAYKLDKGTGAASKLNSSGNTTPCN